MQGSTASTTRRTRGKAPPNGGTTIPSLAVGLVEKVVIRPPNFQSGVINIKGVSPYLGNRFTEKAIRKIEETQREGDRARNRRRRESRDFEGDVEAAKHIAAEGWCGIPAAAFRNALISACKVAGFAMTRAKLTIFVIPDGFDAIDGMPLVKISGQPKTHKSFGRNDNGSIDLRWRPVWPQWSCALGLRWDADQFSVSDVVNLTARAGLQVGVGEGRPDSRDSNGLGLGLWEIQQS
jgi:hypothetical protein